MKYQVRINDTMADLPASGLFDTYSEAHAKLEEVKKEIAETWATPETDAAYIFCKPQMEEKSMRFKLNNGHTYTRTRNGNCFVSITGGKKMSCSYASFKMAYKQFVTEENERQNEAKEFFNIYPIS